MRIFEVEMRTYLDGECRREGSKYQKKVQIWAVFQMGNVEGRISKVRPETMEMDQKQ